MPPPNPWDDAFTRIECDPNWLDKRLAVWPRGKSLRVNKPRSKEMTPEPELLAMLREGDELWWASSPPFLWEKLCGRAGFAIVRDGQIIDFELRMMN